jgi:DNA-binding MarR family transcriptional regulator
MTEKERTGPDLLAALADMTMLAADDTNAMAGEICTGLGLTGPEATLLWQLDPAAAPPSMREMAATLRRDPSTITSLVDGLEAKKLITRRLDPLNRRVKTLVLSAKGRTIRQRLIEGMRTRSPVAQLSEDDQRDLYRLLSKFISEDRLRGDWVAGSSVTKQQRPDEICGKTKPRPRSA